MTDIYSFGPSRRPALRLLAEEYAVCYLAADEAVPTWATNSPFHAITRTADELSVVCRIASVPPTVQSEGPWRCLAVEGPLDFALTGILAGLAAPLAEAGIPIFALSTYRTDYLLVPAERTDAAISALRTAGYEVNTDVQDQP
jgi:hypothetical protein